eukprot:TRINITY_DN5996_c0_g1_i9.p2 TRINITY_DN5996_c0_g1~~TRINITY_DN5996_c0_g1_i9.p2  ORF type:complete len:105 (-),score=14.21 TRINITY_DN5996_c0_g1_i9:16-330(-)
MDQLNGPSDVKVVKVAMNVPSASPYSTAAPPTCTLIVADTRNYRILLFPSGTNIGIVLLGMGGDGPNGRVGLNYPSGVHVTPDGVVYVSDTNNHRVVALRMPPP